MPGTSVARGLPLDCVPRRLSKVTESNARPQGAFHDELK